jgi:hypothetical protein
MYLSFLRWTPSINFALHVVPMHVLEILDNISGALGTCVVIGASMSPFRIAPRQIAVRLLNQMLVIMLRQQLSRRWGLPPDNARLTNLNSLVDVLGLKTLIYIGARAKPPDKNNSLDRASAFWNQYHRALLTVTRSPLLSALVTWFSTSLKRPGTALL